jgi:hypothetical protein
MRYFELLLESGLPAYQEVFDGRVLRITDLDGNTIELPEGEESSFVGEVFPSWGLPDPPPEHPTVYPRRRLTKLDFINRFTDQEYVTILGATKQSLLVEAWWKKFELSTPNLDGTSIDLNDPRTIAGVQGLEAMGIIAEGRAAEILE